jgi:hypothetical protein
VQVVSHKGPSEDKVQYRGRPSLKKAASRLEYRAKSVYYAIFPVKLEGDAGSAGERLKYFPKNKDFAEGPVKAVIPESILIHFPSRQES